MNRNVNTYPDHAAMVDMIAANLERQVAEWLNSLYNKQASELWDYNLFIRALRTKFEDGYIVLQAEKDIHEVKQIGRLAKE